MGNLFLSVDVIEIKIKLYQGGGALVTLLAYSPMFFYLCMYGANTQDFVSPNGLTPPRASYCPYSGWN